MDGINYIIQRKFILFPLAFSIGSAAALKFYLNVTRGKFKSNRRMDGKTIIVTGSNTGIGKETAKDLAKRGAKVILACRNMEKANKVVKEIHKETRNKNVYAIPLDLSSFESVRQFVEKFSSQEDRLDCLINNAGVFAPWGKYITDNGLDLTFQSNHFGPFLLTMLLLPKLKDSKPSRIINVSSRSHIRSDTIDFSHFKAETLCNPYKLYSESKLCNILFTRYLAEQLRGTGVTVNCLHPGVVRTELARNVSGWRKYGLWVAGIFVVPFLKSPIEGAQTTIYCTVDSGLEKISGEYFGDCKIKSTAIVGRDMGLAKKLWEASEDLTGYKFDD